MASFVSLSAELILMIAQELTESEDLFNFRQSCRYLQHCSKPHYLRRYFYRRRHMFSRHSLEVLQKIVSDDALSITLHELVIGIDHLTDEPPLEDPLPFQLWVEDSSMRTNLDVNRSSYNQYLADQNNLLDSGLGAAYLTGILSKTKNCKALTIDNDHRSWGAGFLKRQTGVYPTTDLNWRDSQEFIAKAVEAVFVALTASGVQLQALEIYTSPDMPPISPEALALPWLQPLELPFSASLISLVLAIETGDVYDLEPRAWPKIVTRFILHFPSLETLGLFFEPRIEPECFHAISQALYIPRLRTLKLSTVSCTGDDLTQLFRSHQATLQEVSVDTVNLIHAGGSWRSLLTCIRDEFRLARFSAENCFQDDMDICIQGDDIAFPSVKIEASGGSRA